MERREAIRMTAALATFGVLAVKSPASAYIATRRTVEPLPHVRSGDVLTEKFFVDLVERVNDLTANQ